MAQASVLSNDEVRRVFRIIETTRHSARNRLAVGLSFYAGMRVGEIAHLSIGDVATPEGEPRREIRLSKDQTKGSRPRTVMLSRRVQNEIGSYLKHHRSCADPNEPLITSQKGGAFTPQTLAMMFREIFEQAGLRTSSHSGRRTYATVLNAKGVGVRTIQHLLGHKHIQTTARYCDVSDDQLRNAVEMV